MRAKGANSEGTQPDSNRGKGFGTTGGLGHRKTEAKKWGGKEKNINYREVGQGD